MKKILAALILSTIPAFIFIKGLAEGNGSYSYAIFYLLITAMVVALVIAFAVAASWAIDQFTGGDEL